MNDSPAILPVDLAGPCAPPVRLVGCPHPLRMERIDSCIPAGLTLLEMVAQSCDELKVPAALRGFGYAWIDGKPVPFSKWGNVRPGPGQTVTVRVVPGSSGGGGGGGKDVGRAIMTIAVVAAAVYTAGAASTWLVGQSWASVGINSAYTIGQIGGAIAGMGVAVAGMAAVNAMVPVRAAQVSGARALGGGGANTSEEAYSISGMQNVLDPYGPIPLALGRVRWAPKHAAKPYTETVENERYIRANLDFGYGPLEIEEPRIGDTALEDFEGVENETTTGDDGVVPALFPDTVHEEALNVALEYNEPVVRTTAPDCDEFSVDIAFPRLVSFGSGGGLNDRTCRVDLEWRKVGGSAWKGTTEILGHDVFNMSGLASGPGVAGRTLFSLVTIMVNPESARLTATSIWYSTGPDGTGYREPRVFNGWNPLAIIEKSGPFASPEYEIVKTFEPDGWSGLEVSVNDDGVVSVAGGFITSNPFNVTAASSDPVFRTRVVQPGERGQYEIRLTRKTEPPTSTQVFDDVLFSGLRSIVNEPSVNVDFPNARTELRIKASGELNGTLDRYNAQTMTVCKDYDHESDSWVKQATNNCASLGVHALQCAANPRPRVDSQIDWPAWEDFHDWCRIGGFTFNQKRDGDADVWEALQDICGAGRAAPCIRDGKWSVVIDRPRTSVVQDITRAMCWGFKGSRDLRKTPHMLRVSFLNDETWETDEVAVYADGYSKANATLIEVLDLPGVTNAEQAWRLGRYHLACMDRRREVYTWSMDWAHIISQRGDLVTVTHPVPLWGLSDGRIKSVEDQGGGAWRITVNEPCVMESGKAYCVRLISNELTRCVRPVTLAEGENFVLDLPAEAGALDPEKGWRFAFGEEGHESQEVLVTGIRPGPDFTAELTGVDYAPEVYTADSGTMPAWSPNITTSPFVAPQAPNAPRILTLKSDESVMIRDADKRLKARISVVYALVGGRVSADTVEAQVRAVGEAWRNVSSVAAGLPLFVSGVVTGAAYDVRIRSVGEAGAASAWVTVEDYTVVGATNPPPNVPGAVVTGKVLSWVYPDPPIDFAGFRVRYAPGVSAVWDRATTLPGDPLLSEHSVDLSGYEGELTWLIRAEDVYGNQSALPAQITVGLGDRAPVNVVVSWPQAPAWAGELSGCEIADGKLKALSGGYLTGNPDVVALTGDPNAAEIQADWQDVQYDFVVDTTGKSGELVVNRAGSDGLALEYSTTSSRAAVTGNPDAWALKGDPDASEIDGRTEYQRWPGGVDCGGMVWLRAKCPGGADQGEIASLTPVVDVPDIEEIVEDVDISTAGTRLVLTKDFTAIKAVVPGIQDNGLSTTGIRIVDKDATLGPLLQALGANARIDARVIGY